jgi:hypothetical protein
VFCAAKPFSVKRKSTAPIVSRKSISENMRKVTDKEDAHVLRKAKGERVKGWGKDYGLRGKEQVEVEIKVKIEKKNGFPPPRE